MSYPAPPDGAFTMNFHANQRRCERETTRVQRPGGYTQATGRVADGRRERPAEEAAADGLLRHTRAATGLVLEGVVAISHAEGDRNGAWHLQTNTRVRHAL